MTKTIEDLHVYLRTIRQDERTSLSVLASLVREGATVLDLGCGSGALGQYLRENRSATSDGLTWSEAEAEHARPHYRRVVVANLETCDLPSLFAGQTYDYIVCADVLEHLTQPEKVLEACRSLLSPDGRLLTSVPNAGYAGLVAELLQGEFRYRPEGLLDRTHLRFFTRRSLARFMGEHRWSLDSLDTIRRELPESEFKVAFDQLPPSVARHLLAVPDALTYQFIGVARPSADIVQVDQAGEPDPEPASALFTAQLYLGEHGEYSEENKLSIAGAMGRGRQILRFPLPHSDRLTHLRFDPADRPGFMHLYGVRLKDTEGRTLWAWSAEESQQALLDEAAHNHIVWQAPLIAAAPATLLLLTGEDPWVQLPIPSQVVTEACSSPGATLEVEFGWPMSADYMALAGTVRPLQSELLQVQAKAREEQDRLRNEAANLEARAAAELERIRNEMASAQASAVAEQERLRNEMANAAAAEHERLRNELVNAQAAAAAEQERLRWDVLNTEQAHLRAREEERAAAAAARQALEESSHQMLAAAEAALRLADESRLAAEKAAQQALESAQARHRMELEQAEAAARLEKERLLNTQATLVNAKDGLTRQRSELLKEAAAQRRHAEQLEQNLQRARRDFAQLEQHLRSIETSTVFRVTRPVVHAKMRVDRLLGRNQRLASPALPPPAAESQGPRPMQPTSHPVDVIVPVYRGLADTQLCIDSVLASPVRVPYRLVVINDCSPEPEVTQWLRARAAQDSRITLLENPENLGFVGTVNRGMELSDSNDVLLLNSDTEVANDWLDRIRAAAYGDQRIASVTPFSTNATICSYPEFCKDNALPPGYDTARIDALCARTNPGAVVDVPTGVGFCMYIRRDSLHELGLFDTENFGKGYGEENDFCQRAFHAGWRNLHLLDTFVLHTGGVSFGDSKSPREQAAMATLARLHPNYARDVHAFVQADPARPYRLALDAARIAESGLPVILNVLHDRAGGTVRHVRELAAHLADQAVCLTLAPGPGRTVLLRFARAEEGFELSFQWDSQHGELLNVLRRLGVGHVHFHHLLGHDPAIRDLPYQLGVSYDFTAHDYFSYCAHITLTGTGNSYAGELGPGQCVCCPPDMTAPSHGTVAQWRAANIRLLMGARHVLTPSCDTARRISPLVPGVHVLPIPHTDVVDAASLPLPAPRQLPPRAALKIVVIGAISIIKGAEVLEAVALEAARRDVPIEFHLIGYAYRHLQTQPRSRLTIHGGYAEEDLPRLIDWLQPDLAWFPAQWPETYSYTLSAALQAGLPVAVGNLGAFAERVAGRPWSWVCQWDLQPKAWVDAFVAIRENHFVTGEAPSLVQTQPEPIPPVEVPDWHYRSHYLRELPLPSPHEAGFSHSLAPAQLQDYVPQASAADHAKSSVLDAIVYLRSLPVLRGVARRIPAHWQRRVKDWLTR